MTGGPWTEPRTVWGTEARKACSAREIKAGHMEEGSVLSLKERWEEYSRWRGDMIKGIVVKEQV